MCVDIPVGLGNGCIELEIGATVETAIRHCRDIYAIEMTIGELLKSYFLVNTRPANIEQVLVEGDNLTVVRPLAGG